MPIHRRPSVSERVTREISSRFAARCGYKYSNAQLTKLRQSMHAYFRDSLHLTEEKSARFARMAVRPFEKNAAV